MFCPVSCVCFSYRVVVVVVVVNMVGWIAINITETS